MAQVTAVSGHGETKLQVDDTARRVSGHVQGGRETLAEIPRIVNPQDNQRKKRRSRQDLLTASSENQSAGYVCNRASNSGDAIATASRNEGSLLAEVPAGGVTHQPLVAYRTVGVTPAFRQASSLAQK